MGLYEKLKFAIASNSHDSDTLSAYWGACRKFYAFCGKPASQWCGTDVGRWLVSLYEQNYSRSSRKNALCAMAYVFKHILKADMGTLNLPPMPPERKPLKTIPTPDEIAAVLSRLKGQVKTAAALIYGSGPRIDECVTRRVQDVDFEALTLRIWDGKNGKHRLTVLPALLVPLLRKHIEWRRELHEYDKAHGGGRVELPGQLARKYPNADREFRWQFLFPSAVTRGDFRWHMTEKAIQENIRAAVNDAGIIKRITPHTLRHAFATHSLRLGNDIETVRQLLGHDSIATTAIYLHADGARGVSPLDIPRRQNSMVLPPLEAPRAHLFSAL